MAADQLLESKLLIVFEILPDQSSIGWDHVGCFLETARSWDRVSIIPQLWQPWTEGNGFFCKEVSALQIQSPGMPVVERIRVAGG